MFKNLFSHPEQTSQKTIFVLANEESIAQQIVEVLQETGYQVQTASDPQAAMELLDQPPFPDLLILDYFMAHMDTTEFLVTLRQRFGRIDLAPVLLLANDEIGEAAANSLQVQDYLQKPFTREELLMHVQHIFDNLGSSTATH
jgi:CheY-like chemotaxis protein